MAVPPGLSAEGAGKNIQILPGKDLTAYFPSYCLKVRLLIGLCVGAVWDSPRSPPALPRVCSLKLAPMMKTKSPPSLWKALVYPFGTRTIFVPPEGLAPTSPPCSGSQQHPAFTTTLGPRDAKGQFDTKMSAGSTQRELTRMRGSQLLPRRCSHMFSASAQGLGNIWELTAR